MKKSLWLLLAITALIAVFAVAGCQPTTPGATESPEPTESPTAPPADTACPKVVSTVVGKVYQDDGYGFKLTITFDEAITSSCVEDPAKWTIKVKNSDREDDELTSADGDIGINDISVSADGKKVYVEANVEETISYKVNVKYTVGDDVYEKVVTIDNEFTGLICSEDDAENYANPFTKADIAGKLDEVSADNILSFEVINVDAPEYADAVEWKLEDCVIADDLGNACCDYSGSACCLEPTCAECEEEGCVLGSEGSCL